MPLHLITGPTSEPLTLAQAKSHIRIDDAFTDDDDEIMSLITAVREYAEHLCSAKFVTQQWLQVQDAFNGYGLTGVPFGEAYSLPQNAIRLQKGPVASVDSIQYVDYSHATQTMDSSLYTADVYGSPALITPKFGQIWPIPIPEINAVRITFTVGYGAGTAVPAGLVQWMKIRLDTLFNYRGEYAQMRSGTIEPLPHVDRLLDPYRQPIW